MRCSDREGGIGAAAAGFDSRQLLADVTRTTFQTPGCLLAQGHRVVSLLHTSSSSHSFFLLCILARLIYSSSSRLPHPWHCCCCIQARRTQVPVPEITKQSFCRALSYFQRQHAQVISLSSMNDHFKGAGERRQRKRKQKLCNTGDLFLFLPFTN